ncbi:MAG: ATP-binding protein [Clostridia bacterium]|nr:ATP-binding protein [Clostridia bacterium]
MQKGIVIAGFAGIGKTTLAKKYSNVIDIESSPYKYDYSMYDNIDYEKFKGNKDRIKNTNFPQNYIDAINQAKQKYDIVLIWLCDEAIDIYKKFGVDFVVCYPNVDAFEGYKQRYISRGNLQTWIDNVVNYYNEFVVNKLEKSNYKKIILDKGENLEDKLLQLGFKLDI